MPPKLTAPGLVLALAGATGLLAPAPAAMADDALPELAVSSFPSPSTSFWFAALIPQLGLDVEHGFRLALTAKPSQVAYADFVSGADLICYCIAPGAAARFVERGTDVTLLWNVQTYDNILITSDPAVTAPQDLEGRSLGADTTTGSWAISRALLARQGVDLERVEIQSAPISANVTELSLGRISALASSTWLDFYRVDALEPGKFNVVPIADSEAWRDLTGETGTPGWGLGVRTAFLDDPANHDLLQRLYRASHDLVELIREDPDRIAGLVEEIAGIDAGPLARSFRENWSLHLAPISEFANSVRLLGSELLPDGGVLDGPLSEEQYQILLSDFAPE